MNKKQSGKGKRYKDMSMTGLDSMKRNKKILQSPFSQIPNMVMTSWIDQCLPDSLWSVLLSGSLPREVYLDIFRRVLANLGEHKDEFGEIMLSHSCFANLKQEKFKILFLDICNNPDVAKTLSPLLLLESLPDLENWKAVLPSPDGSSTLAPMAVSVAASFNHQSQEATDCRWVRLMTMLVLGKMSIPAEMVETLFHYPHRGDMTSVRPFIRSTEIGSRNIPNKSELDSAWAIEFWKECWSKTQCIPFINYCDEQIDYDLLYKNVSEVYEELQDHFGETVTTTGIDAKHDAAFGLTFYFLNLMTFAMSAAVGKTLQGRIMLRSALEVFLTLRFLAQKDDPTIWMQYRNYGSGQAKLALLKNVNQSELPDFINLDDLVTYANEDMWLEFQDINLGSWSDKNLRKMSDEAGVKDVYDRYYDVLSGYVHGNWVAVRATAFTQCLNPLHRYHRIPIKPHILMSDVMLDLEGVELKFIDLQLGCAYMYVCSKRGRTLSSISLLKKREDMIHE